MRIWKVKRKRRLTVSNGLGEIEVDPDLENACEAGICEEYESEGVLVRGHSRHRGRAMRREKEEGKGIDKTLPAVFAAASDLL